MERTLRHSSTMGRPTLAMEMATAGSIRGQSALAPARVDVVRRTMYIAVLAAFMATTLPAAAQQAGRVSLSLGADRTAYYLGEPVRLTLTVRNEGDEVVVGRFQIFAAHEKFSIYFRRKGDAFRP